MRGALGVLCAAALTAAIANAAISPEQALQTRSAEIAECRPGEISRWPDGQDRPAVLRPMRFTVDPNGVPNDVGAAIDLRAVTVAVNRAAEAWSACGVASELLPWQAGMETRSDVIRIFWSNAASQGNFGLANLGQRTLALGPAAFRLLRERNPAHDAVQTLQMVLAHEMGHFYGLMAHSRRCVDVTSYYNNAQGEQCYSRAGTDRRFIVEYRHSLPTACDIQRCRQANGLPMDSTQR